MGMAGSGAGPATGGAGRTAGAGALAGLLGALAPSAPVVLSLISRVPLQLAQPARPRIFRFDVLFAE